VWCRLLRESFPAGVAQITYCHTRRDIRRGRGIRAQHVRDGMLRAVGVMLSFTSHAS
jgi:hypothetical protein